MKSRWQVCIEFIWKAFNPILTAAVAGSIQALCLVFTDPTHVDWAHIWPIASGGAFVGVLNLYRPRPGNSQ